MAKQIDIEVKESVSELNKLLLKQHNISNRSRIKMLLLIREKKVTYTKDLMPKLKHCRKTIYNWIALYRHGGLAQLLTSNKGGNNTPLIEEQTKVALAEKLSDTATQITSYIELLDWVQQNYQANVNYAALYKHCRVHHNSVLKVARKSHHKKDEQAVEAFKKTT